MSAIDNTEVARASDSKSEETMLSDALKSGASNLKSSEAYTLRKPKRILHFSDGTLEEFDDTESDQEDDGVDEGACQKSSVSENLTTPVNPKTMPWSSWFHHYTSTTGHRTLSILDNIGENIAYYLGITTPKYQYEIDEYKRGKEQALAKQKEKEIELNSWATHSPNPDRYERPIVTEVLQNPESLK